MARYFAHTLVLLLLFSSLSLQSQNTKEEGKLGLPGDNLNLYAALKLFQESATLEEFEKKLVTGDEQLYGKDYIIEPNMAESNARPNPGYTGTTQKIDDKVIVANTVTRNEIAAWPVVQVIYTPSYVVWHSPWYWGHYPGWWSPWRP